MMRAQVKEDRRKEIYCHSFQITTSSLFFKIYIGCYNVESLLISAGGGTGPTGRVSTPVPVAALDWFTSPCVNSYFSINATVSGFTRAARYFCFIQSDGTFKIADKDVTLESFIAVPSMINRACFHIVGR